MARQWQLPGFPDRLTVALRGANAGARAGAVHRITFQLQSSLESCLASASGQRTLLEMFAAVQGQSAPSHAPMRRGRDLRSVVVPALMEAFRRGDLVLLGRSPRATSFAVGSPGESSSTEAEPAEPEVREDRPPTWIEIELVDDDDNPVPHQRYQVVLPDGSIRDGQLNEFGFARVDNVQAGNCSITFPALDRRAWEPA